MKFKKSFNRYQVLLVVLLCYLLPLLGIIGYGTLIVDNQGYWEIFSIGFSLTAFGSLAIFLTMALWEKELANAPSTPSSDPISTNTDVAEDYDFLKRSLDEAQQAQVRLLSEIDLLTDETRIAKSEKEELLGNWKREEAVLEQYKESLHQELEQQQNLIRELYETIADQKAQLETKLHQQTQLEAKVGGLTHEIKTILQFAETHAGSILNNEDKPIQRASPPPPLTPSVEIRQDEPLHLHVETKIQSNHEASQLLKRCLEIAQRITGSQRFGSQIYSFLESPADSFALDLRRLCDKLRSETGGIILLYSPRDNHVLFANNEIKGLTGWSPEKFSQQFRDILVDSSAWNHALGSLAMRSEAHAQIQIKARSGEVIDLSAALGMIPTGIFRNHAVAILYAGLPAGALENQIKY